MKPKYYLPAIILAAVGTGVFQQIRLSELSKESAQIITSTVKRPPVIPARNPTRIPTPLGPGSPAASSEEIETVLIQTFGTIADARLRDRRSSVELAAAEDARKKLMTAFAKLDAQTAFELIPKLAANSSLPNEIREHAAEFLVEAMTQTNPSTALQLLQLLTEYPDRENAINQAFDRWAAAEPIKALQWFHEESSKKPDIAAPAMMKAAACVQARVDPAKALSKTELDQWMTTDASQSAIPGAIFAASMKNPREHQAFLKALGDAQKKRPDSPELAKIRSGYLQELSNKLYEWPFEEAIALIDGELSTAEKIVATQDIAHRLDTADPELWADWFGKLETPAGGKSPQYEFLLSWMRGDAVAAGKWLEKSPPGEMKDQLDFNYAWMLLETDPAKGMEWAMKIADGPVRAKAIPKLIEKWKTTDPAAATAFAEARGLK